MANLFLYFSLDINAPFNNSNIMSWDDYLNPHEQPEFECGVCGKPMHQDKDYCSNNCYQADMM